MKRLVLTFLLAVVVLTVSGCSDGMDEEPRADTSKMFVRVENCGSFDIMYDKDTKVMYTVNSSGYPYGNVTLLVNSDGTPKIWKGRWKHERLVWRYEKKIKITVGLTANLDCQKKGKSVW